MKYSQDGVWAAVYVFLPSYQAAKEAGVTLNLPSALVMAAKEAFMLDDQLTQQQLLAAKVIRTALKELDTDSMMTFGETNLHFLKA
jgi:hypothetical protein